MTSEQKIKLADILIANIKDSFTTQDIPKCIGTLNKPQGIVGFVKADIGHPVFEFKGRYIIYLERNDGKLTIELPYNKETLKPVINFL